MGNSAPAGRSRTAAEVVEKFGGAGSLAGKIAVVTGGNSGIGTETVKQLTIAGAHVVVGSRSVANGIAALKEAGIDTSKTSVVALELEDLASVNAFAAEVLKQSRLDYIVFNAGIMALPTLEYTKHGFEKQLGVNHIGHQHLLSLLLPTLQRQAFPSRVVALSSLAHARGTVELADLHFKKGRAYSPWGAYGQSKSANILMIRELADRLGANSNITALSVHPGVIQTNLTRNMNVPSFVLLLVGWAVFDKSIAQGAATTMTACLDPALLAHSGAYLSDCEVLETNEHCRDASGELRRGLWSATEADIAAALA